MPFIKTTKYNQTGFTLVEMAIIIVIIGLLAASIVTAQALTEAARTRSILTDLLQLKAGYDGFRIKFNAWPGDMSNATAYWPTSANGDGDNLIEYLGGAREDLRAWQQMSLSETIPGDYTGALDEGWIVMGLNIPMSRIDTAGYWVTSDTVYGKTANALVFASLNAATELKGSVGDSQTFWSVDRKIDDSSADSGFIYSANGFTNLVTQTSGCVTGNVGAATSDYILTNTDPLCYMYIWMEQ